MDLRQTHTLLLNSLKETEIASNYEQMQIQKIKPGISFNPLPIPTQKKCGNVNLKFYFQKQTLSQQKNGMINSIVLFVDLTILFDSIVVRKILKAFKNRKSKSN